MAHTLRKPASTTPNPGSEPRPLPAEEAVPPPASERRGCLFALSQLPLIGFLGFIATLLLMAALHDLFLL